MSNKRKSVALIDSSSGSDSELSESEFQNLAKKRKKSPKQIRKSSESSDDASSSDEEEHQPKPTAKTSAEREEKSSDVEDGEVSESESDVGEFDDGLDDELMGDEEDRKRLEMMNEKEREEEIFKRAEKREMLKKRYEIEKKLKMQKKSSKEEEKSVNKGLDTKERSRARKEAVENKKDKKTLALDVLKAKRKEKQEQLQKMEDKKKKEEDNDKESKKKWKANDIYSSDSSDDEVERERSRSPEKKRSSSSSSSSSSVSSRSRTPSPDLQRKRETISSKEELEKVTMTRTKLERWVHLPFFDEMATGCFVRIAIGENTEGKSTYRVAEIIGVTEGPKVYNLGKTRTNKTLRLRHVQQEKSFRMEFASNNKFTESEFIKWKESTMLSGIYLPTVKEIEDKHKQMQKADARELNEKDIMHIVKQKERFMVNPRNYAMYKSRLTKERDVAAAEGNYDEADKLTRKLAEIEERAEDLDRKRSEKISSIALINHRNRKNNIAKAEVNIKQEMEKKRLEGEKSDPFTRRKTKPILATSVIKKNKLPEEPKTKSQIQEAVKKPETVGVESEKPKEEKKENEPGKDLFSAHDFDIEINLDTFTPNSAIKMNLTPVINTKKDIGPKKSLNLSDYKKKRGLI